jgi:glucan biosynthesis protein C
MPEAPTREAPTRPTGSRIVGLDAMRAILLSYGIFVHASNLKGEPLFVAIEHSSGLFRMAAFFFLSGLLAAITMDRATPRRWLAARAVALGVPLLFGLDVLNRLFFLLHDHAPRVGFMAGFVERNRFTWHLHLWFLFCLLAYSAAASAIRVVELRRPGRRRPMSAELIPPHPRLDLAAVALVIAFPFATLALQRLGARVPPLWSGLAPWKHIIVSTFRYAPYFFLGFFMPRVAAVRALFSSPVYWLIGLLSIPAVLDRPDLAVDLTRSPALGRALFDAGRAAFALTFILVVTPLVVRQRSVPPALSALSRSAYTIYLLHLLLISACFHAFAWLGWGVYPAWIATIAIVFAVATAIHFAVVERCPWARFLLNGRTSDHAGAPPAPVQRPVTAPQKSSRIRPASIVS